MAAPSSCKPRVILSIYRCRGLPGHFFPISLLLYVCLLSAVFQIEQPMTIYKIGLRLLFKVADLYLLVRRMVIFSRRE